MQEFVLDAERDRLAKAVEHASKSRVILQELLNVYDVDAHFMAERSVYSPIPKYQGIGV